MSYTFYVFNPEDPEGENETEDLVIDGQCDVMVTFNYAPIAYRDEIFGRLCNEFGTTVWGDLIKGQCSKAIPILEEAISQLRDDVTDDMYQCTEGNLKKKLNELLEWSKRYPEYHWGYY